MRTTDYWTVLVAELFVAAGLTLWLALNVQANQLHPSAWQVTPQGAALVVLDAPPKGYSEWALLVKVGETEFEIPRVELRKLALAHPDWRR